MNAVKWQITKNIATFRQRKDKKYETPLNCSNISSIHIFHLFCQNCYLREMIHIKLPGSMDKGIFCIFSWRKNALRCWSLYYITTKVNQKDTTSGQIITTNILSPLLFFLSLLSFALYISPIIDALHLFV